MVRTLPVRSVSAWMVRFKSKVWPYLTAEEGGGGGGVGCRVAASCPAVLARCSAAAESLLSRDAFAGSPARNADWTVRSSAEAYTMRCPHARPSATNRRLNTSAWAPPKSSSTRTMLPSGTPPPMKPSRALWPVESSHCPSTQRRAPAMLASTVAVVGLRPPSREGAVDVEALAGPAGARLKLLPTLPRAPPSGGCDDIARVAVVSESDPCL